MDRAFIMINQSTFAIFITPGLGLDVGEVIEVTSVGQGQILGHPPF